MPFDVLFVGGGVIGLSGAWRCAERGLATAVVDPSPGGGASWVAGGMLAPVTEAHFGEEPLISLLVAGAAEWKGFAEDLERASEMPVGFKASGTVVVGFDGSDQAVIDEMVAFQDSLGLEVSRLSPSGCRRLVPALSPALRGGAHVPGDHQVDNRRTVIALRTACVKRGVTMVDQRVHHLSADGQGCASGVLLEDGSTLEARIIWVTAGADSAGIGGIPGSATPPVRPVKGLTVRLQGSPKSPLLERTVRGLVRGRPCYLVPREDGSVVLGATSEERGFDRRVQAGMLHQLLDDGRRIVPGIDELEVVECLVGLRPGSPDNAPIVGWSSMPGLGVATGHYRNGILLAPITAHAISALSAGEEIPPALAGCSPDRFSSNPATTP